VETAGRDAAGDVAGDPLEDPGAGVVVAFRGAVGEHRPVQLGAGQPGGEAAAAAARTGTFLGERYRRIVRRRGKLKALVATARTILVIIWHLLADRTGRYHDLGSGYYASRIDKDRKTRNHIHQLEALGFTVTLASAA